MSAGRFNRMPLVPFLIYQLYIIQQVWVKFRAVTFVTSRTFTGIIHNTARQKIGYVVLEPCVFSINLMIYSQPLSAHREQIRVFS